MIELPNSVVTLHSGNHMVLIAPSADITDLDNRQLQNMTVELNVTGGVLNSVNQTARVLIYTQGSVEKFVSKLRAIALSRRMHGNFHKPSTFKPVTSHFVLRLLSLLS